VSAADGLYLRGGKWWCRIFGRRLPGWVFCREHRLSHVGETDAEREAKARAEGFAQGVEAASHQVIITGDVPVNKLRAICRRIDALKPAEPYYDGDTGTISVVAAPPGPPPDMPELPADIAGDPPYYASKARFADMPRAGESTCRGVTGLGKTCVLREGHPGSHCSRTGTEWPK